MSRTTTASDVIPSRLLLVMASTVSSTLAFVIASSCLTSKGDQRPTGGYCNLGPTSPMLGSFSWTLRLTLAAF